MISPPNGYVNKATITLGNELVESSTELKLLGFVFGSDPNANKHIDYIKKKFRQRFWALIHLKNNGFSGNDIMSLFNVYIRPIIEYCSVIYRQLITIAQCKTL